ncbi:MAG TPA: DUF885 domain-containing protein [Gammaproteobacteria bacterium]|nr:DUF885 domain-containing protein [Gammaproteobacteria bacterium]
MRTLISCVLLGAAAQAAADSGYEEQRAEFLDEERAIARNTEGLSAAEQLEALTDLYYDYVVLEFPVFATYVGDTRNQDRWGDNSLAAIERRDEDNTRALGIVRALDRDALGAAEKLNYDLLLRQLQDGEDLRPFPAEFLVLNQLGGVQQFVAQAIALMPATNVREYENILARLRGIPEQVDQTLVLLEEGLERGVTPPAITLREVPQQVANLLVDDPSESALLAAFKNMPADVAAAEQERLRETAAKVFATEVKPAFARLKSYLEKTYLPQARDTIAMKDLPEGSDWYVVLARQSTTTDMTPAEIHELGLREVERIRAAMDEVIVKSGFDGSFEEFKTFLRTDPRFFFDDPESLLVAYRDIAKRADPQLVKLFGRLPRLPYGVVPVPAYAEKSQTTAYYQGGSLEAGRPGEFFANTYALETRPKWEMEALTLHEAVPGHHLQISIQQELDDLPWFRRFGGFTAYVEGWGLYAESLGSEMGFYTDPYSKFGQLTYEMWRAIRLVVDTGIHSLGWSRQQAIDFFEEHSPKSEHDIIVEVDRYIVSPGQALAYKIGELKIKALRELARSELGEDFDIRAFHDVVLGSGALPLNVLEARVEEWIAGQERVANRQAGLRRQ